jgi:hypothetical protein
MLGKDLNEWNEEENESLKTFRNKIEKSRYHVELFKNGTQLKISNLKASFSNIVI